MTDRAPWRAALEEATGQAVVSATAVAGGDIAASLRVELSGGGRLFVKQYAGTPPPSPDFPPIAVAEARGLEWLAAAEVPELRIPSPVANGDDWLALPWIEPAAPARDHDERLGRGLARMHAAAPDDFGFAGAGWIARLPWPNAVHADWPGFFAEERLLPLARQARDSGALSGTLSRSLDRLVDAVPRLATSDEPPARLHGDLWSGNAICDEDGGPCLIDPAAYGGHREIDLAMMRLFGGFGPRVFAAYEEVWPLAPGAEARLPLYQVLPLLVHVCLFGGGYLNGLARAIDDALGFA